ncbi:hypothetical protein C1637_12255 [Chryseobacterium lactis]|uniref:Outer membrane protein beta-barrel domain-containing protein n=1 Tax=Chryseobacterium lactis TaxID=1241981 RepID=A0A3G6RL69_CHRLC|nr:hypothetical protein [Chryseobacterium lactis]AZA80700.1 hypothetical protein EG342_01685 [Chryseobacterium lactis]AZB05702.1 hypothetical protein EG341_17810 [Chryseobacterium lactis]PNW13578.1 hypothetical protein C1637_12255 [Chryseobacterium lactis]
MKKYVFLLTLLFPFYGQSQISIQAYGGNKESEILGIYSKDFKSKWNYFASGTIAYTYDSKKVTPELYQNLNYGIGKNWGVSAGVHISDQDIMPSVGLAYGKENDVFGISIFPAVTYSTDAKQFGLGLYTLLEYTPKINERFNFYSMLIVESDFSFKEHQSSSQVIRLGLETKKKMQFGIGSNIAQTGSTFESEANFGVFIGKKF